MKLGYARVSTDDQSLALQIEQLKAAGCVRIHQETKSGKTAMWRTELERVLAYFESPRLSSDYDPTPDILVVTKLDRLARNTRDLLEIVDRINKAGAGLISLSESWDTTTPAGRMAMTMLAAVAEFERARILERTLEGRKLAMKNGVKFGRPPKLSQEQQRAAIEMLKSSQSVRSVSRVFKVNRKTIAALRDK